MEEEENNGARGAIVYRQKETDICRVEICLSAIERNAHPYFWPRDACAKIHA